MPRFLRHVRHHAVAYLALFVALGGTSYAATALPRASVGAQQLKANAVTGSKIRNGSIGAADLKASARVTGPKGDAGSQGAQGPQGPAGQPGAAGARGEQGPAGPLLDVLPAGRTVKGVFGTAGHRAAPGDYVDEGSLSFPVPLAAAPTQHVLLSGAAPTAECPGSSSAPAAAPGQLCLYATVNTGGTDLDVQTEPFGANYFVRGFGAGAVQYEWKGTWAATAA